MVFRSVIFIFYFLPVFLLGYYVSGWRAGALLLGSAVFYTWGEGAYLFLLLGLIALNYAGSLWLSAAPAGPAFAGLSAIKSQSYAGTSQVVEIRGERGEPQPAEWIVILHDPSARGGVRELTIVNGQITAERTPLRGPTEIAALVPMDSSMFKLDSDAVFRTVQSESVRNQIGFDWIDYKLRTDPETKAPAWSVCLFDKEGSALATMRISAGDGALLCPLQVNASARARKDASEDIIPVGGLVGTEGDRAAAEGFDEIRAWEMPRSKRPTRRRTRHCTSRELCRKSSSANARSARMTTGKPDSRRAPQPHQNNLLCLLSSRAGPLYKMSFCYAVRACVRLP